MGQAGCSAATARYRFTISAVSAMFGIVFRRILDLLEIVEAAVLVDAVGAGDEPRRPPRIGIEMLVDRARRNVDDVARLPIVALDVRQRTPFIGIADLDVAVLVEVVAAALDDVEALFGEVAVPAGPAARRDHLHVGVDRLHPRVHLFVEQVLEQTLPRHLPRHVLGPDDLLAPCVAHRLRRGILQQVPIERLVQTAAHPRLCFVPSHASFRFPKLSVLVGDVSRITPPGD